MPERISLIGSLKTKPQNKQVEQMPGVEQIIQMMEVAHKRDVEPVIKRFQKWRAESDRKQGLPYKT